MEKNRDKVSSFGKKEKEVEEKNETNQIVPNNIDDIECDYRFVRNGVP